MKRREFIILGSCAAAVRGLGDVVPEVDLTGLSVADFRKAVETIERTRVGNIEGRSGALEVLQRYIYAMKTGEPYEKFSRAGLSPSADEVKKIHETYPVLWWYDRAFDKVRDELRTTRVTGDVPAVWYVYNMGVVVKTKTCAFAIDLCHRKAGDLVPDLDFALISHNHQDHYLPDFLTAMDKAGKPCFSNFRLRWDCYVAEERTIEIKDVKVHFTRTDHNVHLPSAVNCHEVECGGEKPFVIFHSGDSYRADQLRPKNRSPDLFFGHCAIGFNFPAAYKTTMPAKRMITVHHQELGHLGGRWRCVGFHEEPAKIRRQFVEMRAPVVEMPVWGDRIV